MKDQSILIIIVGALAGLFPILLTASVSWLEKRSLFPKQNRALDLAQKRVEFLDSWVKVQETLSSTERFEEIKQAVSAELDGLSGSLSEELAEEEEEEEGEISFLQRLFLAYLPHNVTGWVLHILFYMILGVTLINVYEAGIDGPTTDSWTVLEALFFWDWYAPWLILLFIIRWFAVRADRKAEEKMAALHAGKRVQPVTQGVGPD